MENRVFHQTSDARHAVESMRPFLGEPLARNLIMDARVMRPEDVLMCPWLGFGVGKGVTHPEKNISVFATPNKLKCGLHGELIQHFSDVTVDDVPHCYHKDAPYGFGGFVRWVYLGSPDHRPSWLGIDFSLDPHPEPGVAASMKMVTRVIVTVTQHGMPIDTRVALMNERMCEHPALTKWRAQLSLYTIRDWLTIGTRLFEQASAHCDVCGCRTFEANASFCVRCGNKRQKETDHVETHAV